MTIFIKVYLPILNILSIIKKIEKNFNTYFIVYTSKSIKHVCKLKFVN